AAADPAPMWGDDKRDPWIASGSVPARKQHVGGSLLAGVSPVAKHPDANAARRGRPSCAGAEHQLARKSADDEDSENDTEHHLTSGNRLPRGECGWIR